MEPYSRQYRFYSTKKEWAEGWRKALINLGIDADEVRQNSQSSSFYVDANVSPGDDEKVIAEKMWHIFKNKLHHVAA